MAFLERLSFQWDAVVAVQGHVAAWAPRDCRTEKDYERSLHAFLQMRLKDTSVVPQYAFGRHKADLLINGNVVLEIKCNLRTTAEYQRLIGQLDQYKRWDGAVIVLLVGGWDETLRIDLKKWIAGDWVSNFIWRSNPFQSSQGVNQFEAAASHSGSEFPDNDRAA